MRRAFQVSCKDLEQLLAFVPLRDGLEGLKIDSRKCFHKALVKSIWRKLEEWSPEALLEDLVDGVTSSAFQDEDIARAAFWVAAEAMLTAAWSPEPERLAIFWNKLIEITLVNMETAL